MARTLRRSLGVLQQQGLVKLKGEVDATKATVDDIAFNPKNLKIKTIDAAQLARSLDTVDVALVPATTLGQPNSIRVPRSPWKSRMMV